MPINAEAISDYVSGRLDGPALLAVQFAERCSTRMAAEIAEAKKVRLRVVAFLAHDRRVPE